MLFSPNANIVVAFACLDMASSVASSINPVGDARFVNACKPTPCSDVNQEYKDASKRKRINRTAKLKQCKLDARREQWLSQGKQQQQQERCENVSSPHCKEKDSDHDTEKDRNSVSAAAISEDAVQEASFLCPCEGNRRTAGKRLQIKCPECKEYDGPTGEQTVGLGTGSDDFTASTISSVSDCSETDSSPKSGEEKSPKNKVTKLERSFESDRVRPKSQPGRNCKSNREDSENIEGLSSPTDNGNIDAPGSSSTASSGYSGGGRDGSDEIHDCEDDWEAAADALDVQVSLSGKNPHFRSISSKAVVTAQQVEHIEQRSKSVTSNSSHRMSGFRDEKLRNLSGKAWRPDDSSRPSFLPTLAKQLSLPAKHKNQAWSQTACISPTAPSHCPICIEELDSTDSSFIPCLCGFQLCLFCHHRILSEDGRCPGCRKPYDMDIALKLSFSGKCNRVL